MKKILSILLVFVMIGLVAVSGCTDTTEEDTEETVVEDETVTEDATNETVADVENITADVNGTVAEDVNATVG